MAGRHANWCLMSQKCGHFHKKKRWSGMKMTECFHGLTFSLDTDQVGSLKECTAENKGIFFFLLLSFSLLSVVQIKLQWLIYTSFKSLSVHAFTPYKPKPISDRFKRSVSDSFFYWWICMISKRGAIHPSCLWELANQNKGKKLA